VGRCGVGSTLAFGSIGHGFESEHRLFSHHGASAFQQAEIGLGHEGLVYSEHYAKLLTFRKFPTTS